MLAFPWRSLEIVRRADLGLLAAMRRGAMRVVDLPGAESALRDLIGPCELSIRLRRVTSSVPRIEDGSLGVLLAPAERPNAKLAFAITFQAALASTLAARAIRRPAPRIADPSARPSPSLAGAAAAILVAAARRNALAPLRAIAAGPAQSILAEIVATDPLPISAAFTVLVDHDAYLVSVFAPRSALEIASAPVIDNAALRALGETPIEVPLAAAILHMTAAEVAALSSGDALFPLTITKSSSSSPRGSGFRGELVIAPPDSDVGFTADLGDDGRLVLRDGPHLLEEKDMVDKNDSALSASLAQSIGETPVVVRVEVGSAQMSAREWAALGAGDVVALGKRIGDHVVLRVGGVEVARGELVDVEGEIGVRIVARSGGTVA